jgi:hypothetical protein
MQPVGLLVDSVQCSVCTMSPDPLVIIPKRTLSLPIELLSEVMAIAFTPKPSHTFLPEKPKEKFPLFSGFTQASKLFRQISLREWFRIIRVLKMVDFEYMASSSNFDFHASVRSERKLYLYCVSSYSHAIITGRYSSKPTPSCYNRRQRFDHLRAFRVCPVA